MHTSHFPNLKVILVHSTSDRTKILSTTKMNIISRPTYTVHNANSIKECREKEEGKSIYT